VLKPPRIVVRQCFGKAVAKKWSAIGPQWSARGPQRRFEVSAYLYARCVNWSAWSAFF